MSVSFVGFAGSRSLPSVAAAGGLVSRVVGSVVGSGRAVAVGDCVGADAAVLSARLALPFRSSSSGLALRVFAVGGPVSSSPSWSGFWRGSAVSLVRSAASLAVSPGHGCCAPVAVRFWAGGGVRLPLRARLRRRSAAFVASVAAGGAGAGLVVFVSGGLSASVGSWVSVGEAVGVGLPVVVFPVGCSVSCFPSLGGAWGSAGSGVWSLGFRWVG